MRKTATIIGPGDNGRRMTLEEFDHAEIQEGYLYELSRGVIVVSDVPNRRHLAQLDASRQQFEHYRWTHPGRIYLLAGGGECKILVSGLESERHPDLAVYKSPPISDENLGAVWIPDVAIEIVSPGSENRDYYLKREEYWKVGVREYWVIDAAIREMRVLRRGDDDWVDHVVRPPKIYKTKLLPGLAFDCGRVFEAAEAVGLQDGERA